ncbi:hypothetical protein [Polyangium spumosum]|uniref:Glycosyltransferase RgtA/B/C/D-like domain-containing protein n=1 Tax=Polyangium spumosum TaxID=889282 RepID=A0A6N7PUZ4_9BACT|nr:hypothetical protein [Polyangium spumosum]MRG95387.1 hypothetical protein [Polyangium spumosum]
MTKRRPAWLGLALVLLLGVIVYAPAIRTPYLLDDYLQASMIEGTFPGERGPFELYDFINDADRSSLVERGMLPWWAHPELEIRFFRPLASALRYFEHKAFGGAPLLMHLHSFAWWAAMVLGARALFRRALAPRAAAIATAVFALAPAHAIPLAWLANREVLLSLTFGIAGLAAHVRWREGRRLGDAALATSLFTLSLFSGEYAVCFGGYVLALEIVGSRESLLRRAAFVSTFVLPAAGYLFLRHRGGYGSFGSGFYTDPFRETTAFLYAVPRRFFTLLADAWLALDDETLLPGNTSIALPVLLALGTAALVFVPLKRAFEAQDDTRRPRIAWLLLGSLLALVPVLPVVPSPRVLGASLLGVAPAVGMLLDHAWFSASSDAEASGPRRASAQLTALAAIALGFAHLVHGPGTAWLIGRRQQRSADAFTVNAAELRGKIEAPEDAEVVVIRCMASAFFLPFALDERGRLPARFRILSQTGHVLVLRRDARTLDVRVPPEHSLFPMGPGALFRSSDAPIAPGDVFTVPGVRVTVLDVGPRGPRAARFELDRDLESPSLTWITEGRKGFSFAELPPRGFGRPFDP